MAIPLAAALDRVGRCVLGSGATGHCQSRSIMPASQDIDDLKEQHPLLFVSDKPDVGELQKEFERAGGLSVAGFHRERNDRLRYNRWKGRTSDYRKHRRSLGKDPVPWEDASDARVYLADSIIEDLGDVMSSAFERAQLKLKPTEAGDIPRVGQAQIVLDKYRERMTPSLRDEAEYLWQFGLNDSCSVMQAGWERCLSLKQEPLSLAEIVQASVSAVQALESMPAQEMEPEMADKLTRMKLFPMVIEDPALETEAIELLQQFASELAAQLFTKQRAEYGDEFLLNYKLSPTKARHAIRELRSKGRTTFPAPYLVKNQPVVVTRRVGYDYFCPPEMTDLQSSPWHAVREFLSPEEVMTRHVSDGWDYDWCLEVVKSAGQASTWGFDTLNHGTSTDNEDEFEGGAYGTTATETNLCEVIHFYKRYLTEDSLPQIWCTVFSPHCTTEPGDPDEPCYGKHYPYEELPDLFPFVGYRWQKKTRAFTQGMGVPQLVGSDQTAIKTSLDLLLDRQSIEVNPERIVNSRLGMKYKAGPGSQTSSQQYYGNRPLIEYANPPTGNPDLAFKLMDAAHKRVDNYFGLMTENVLPAKWQAKLQRMTERYLGTCSEMWSMVFKLIQRNADERELTRIVGGQVDMPATPDEIAGSFDVGLYFDVKDLDMEFVFKKIEAILKWAVPADRAGTIPMDKLTNMIMTAIDPTYAQILTTDTASASQKVFKEVRDQIALMHGGNPPDMVENDPTAAMKLQFAQQVIFGDAMGQGGNVKYQQALKEDPIFQQHMQVWTQNLEQSVKQDKNKEIGRLGVDQNAVQ